MNQVKSPRDAYKQQYRNRANIRRSYIAAPAFCCAFLCFLLVATAYGQIGADAKHPVTSPGDVKQCVAAKDKAICPFQINIPQVAFDDLRRRVLATQWPEREPSSTLHKACNWLR
jgi:hypothetical protein